MGRAPCCDKAKVKRGPWSPEEDATLKRYVETHGTGGNWIALPQKAGLRRCGKSCRLRWLNYLRPDIKHGGFTEEEDNIIFTLYGQMGSRWSVIASQLPGRTDNDVKNYWNTKLKKKLLLAGQETNQIPTDINPSPFGPTPSLPCPPRNKSYNLGFLTSQSQAPPAMLPLPNIYGGLGMKTRDPIHFSCQEIGQVCEFGLNEKENHNIVTLFQEGSSCFGMENKLVSVLGDQDENSGISMEYRFGFPYDLVGGIWFQENGDMKPQVLDQIVTNQY